MACLSLNLYDTPGLAPRMNVLFWGPGDFPVSYSNRDTSRNAWNRQFYGRYGDLVQQYELSLLRMLNDILILDQVTSQPIRLSTNFTTSIPSLIFTDYEWFPWSICNGCGMPAGNAYSSGHLVPSLFRASICSDCWDLPDVHQFYDLNNDLDINRITTGFHGSFVTDVACQQGALTLPDTWFRPPLWDLLVLQLLRPDSLNLPCLHSTFHLEYPLVLSWFSFTCYALLCFKMFSNNTDK